MQAIMAQLTITQRQCPYTSIAGTLFWIPFSRYLVRSYPRCLQFFRVNAGGGLDLLGSLEPELSTPLSRFKSELDFERKELFVSGVSEQGLFRWGFSVTGGKVQLRVLRSPEGVFWGGELAPGAPLRRGEPFSFPWEGAKGEEVKERLSLGCHKEQDWSAMGRRILLQELLPLWLRLGGGFPFGTYEDEVLWKDLLSQETLLGQCARLVEGRRDPTESLQRLLVRSLQGGDFFVPNFSVDYGRWLGFPCPIVEGEDVQELFLRGGRELIRRLFFKSLGKEGWFLPCLPQGLPCGRFLGLSWGAFALVDLEWSKKWPRRILLTALADGDFLLHFPSDIKNYRLRNDSGWSKQVKVGESIVLKQGCRYYLDRFLG